MSLKLHLDLMSQPCRALYLFFRVAGIPYQDVFVALRKNEHLKPEFGALNPFHKVPVLVDETVPNGQLVIKESCTAARWVVVLDEAMSSLFGRAVLVQINLIRDVSCLCWMSYLGCYFITCAFFEYHSQLSFSRYAASKYLSPSSHWWPRDDERKSFIIDEYLHWQHLNIRSFGSLVFIHTVLVPFRTKQPPNIHRAHRNLLKLGEVVDIFEKHYLDKGTFITGMSLFG